MLSVLITGTLSNTVLRNACVSKYLQKFGGSFDWKEIQEIKAMLPSKETFDKKGLLLDFSVTIAT